MRKNILTGNFICKNCTAMAVKIYRIAKKLTNIIKDNMTDEEDGTDEKCVKKNEKCSEYKSKNC